MHETSWLPLKILSNASSRPSRTSAGRTTGGRGSGVMPRPFASCLTRRGVIVSPLALRLPVGTADISVGLSEQPATIPPRIAARPNANQELLRIVTASGDRAGRAPSPPESRLGARVYDVFPSNRKPVPRPDMAALGSEPNRQTRSVDRTPPVH